MGLNANPELTIIVPFTYKYELESLKTIRIDGATISNRGNIFRYHDGSKITLKDKRGEKSEEGCKIIYYA